MPGMFMIPFPSTCVMLKTADVVSVMSVSQPRRFVKTTEFLSRSC